MNIVILGGAGFIGSNLLRRIYTRTDNFLIIDNLSTGRFSNIKDYVLYDNVNFKNLDLASDDFYNDFCGVCGNVFRHNIHEIYNFACPASPPKYQIDPLNTIKTSLVVDAICKYIYNHSKDCVLLHASTSEVYGDPLVDEQEEAYWGNVNPIGKRSCYDEGKRMAETILKEWYDKYELNIRVIRIFNTYGPYMDPEDGRVITNFVFQALRNKDITIYGDGQQTRSFQYIDDLINGIIIYMRMPIDGSFGPINLGNPHEFTMLDLANKILEILPESTSQLVYKELPSDDPKQRKPNIQRAKERLNWIPKISLDEGLKNTIEFFRENEMN